VLFLLPGQSGAHGSSAGVETKKASVVVIIVVSVLVSVLVVIGLFLGYKYWQKRKRERDQARFLKLFEEGDDIEDELGLSNEL
jgi:cbb3-type cytochrome oxidase subunit 3